MRTSSCLVLTLRRATTQPPTFHRVLHRTSCPLGAGHMGRTDRWQDCARSNCREGAIVAERTFATLHTNAGAIRIELLPNHAPKTVRNFVELAEGTRDYVNPATGQRGSGPY